jgi:hypothetical protein
MPLDTKIGLIKAVKTPLSFCVLSLLVLDGTLSGLALKLDTLRPQLIWTIIGSIPCLVVVVILLAIFLPEALSGERPWQDTHANQLADDLVWGLEGTLDNLLLGERIEALQVVANVITSTKVTDKPYRKFCRLLAGRLEQHADRIQRRLTRLSSH